MHYRKIIQKRRQKILEILFQVASKIQISSLTVFLQAGVFCFILF